MLDEYSFLIPEESNGVIIQNVKELREVETKLREVFNKYNFNETLIPLFEYVELYKKVYTDFDEEKIYKYIGQDGKVIALRWDFTIPLARHYFSQHTEEIGRYSYFGKVYRQEKSYKGRNNESYQAGIELINNPGINGDMECLNMLQEILPNLKLRNLKIELGSAKFFNRICELTGNKQKLIEILDKKNISAMESFVEENNDLNEKLKILLLKLPRLSGDIKVIDSLIENIEDEVIKYSLTELKNTYNELKSKENVIFDLSMCPSMEYYTSLMFKVYSPYSPEAIVSGGRYDSLYKNFKKDVSAIGMGFYLNNMLKAIEKEGDNK